ncbi:MAG: hypothetical protein JSV62_09565 [Promethearchaeota archaeon]|nr:MAG: hypothetical protein JSV62_09565 [Candidatus Lokiarchaeota archaeon]
MKIKKNVFTISILLVFVISICQCTSYSNAQENEPFLIISPKFQMIEFFEDFGIKENLSSINIGIPSHNWTLTEIDINFTSIQRGSETFLVEDGGDSFKTLNYDKQCRAVQINITEPTKILSVEIYGYVENPQDENMLVHINGYDSGTNAPNSTIYGSPVPLNMSIIPNWYKQTFFSPISLSIGYYFLVLNGTDIGDDVVPKYRWYNNDINPIYPDLYIWVWDGSWLGGSTNQCFRYKIHQRFDRVLNPQDINMTAEINGTSYNITNGIESGSGTLSIKNLDFSLSENEINIFVKNNLSIKLLFHFNYRVSLKQFFTSHSTALIRKSLDNKWTINPDFTREYSNYSIKFYYPKNWYNITILKNGDEITSTVIINTDDNFIFFPNHIITDGANWKIFAFSPKIDFTLNIQKTEFKPSQDIKFSVITPYIQGNLTYILIDPLGFEEFRETKQIISQETLFTYNLPANPYEGIYKAYVFWYNGTDAGTETQEFSIILPITIPLEIILNSIFLMIIILGGSISSYVLVKRKRKNKIERQKKKFNIYRDVLSLQHFILSERNSGLTIYEQFFTGKPLNSSLISGFLQAVRVFGIELTETDEQTRSIKLEYQNSKILMSDYKSCRLILIMEKSPTQDFLESVNALSYDIEEQFGYLLENFDGDITQFNEIRDLLDFHLHTSLISPLRVRTQPGRNTSKEQMIINQALYLMKKKNTGHFLLSSLYKKKKEIQLEDIETILNLIQKKVFQPITSSNDLN